MLARPGACDVAQQRSRGVDQIGSSCAGADTSDESILAHLAMDQATAVWGETARDIAPRFQGVDQIGSSCVGAELLSGVDTSSLPTISWAHDTKK